MKISEKIERYYAEEHNFKKFLEQLRDIA